MKPSRHTKGERTGRMVDIGGHLEYRYDPEPADICPVIRTESLEIVELRRRHDGWTATRQRVFVNVLANAGSVATAAKAAGITPRSAYRLRNHPKGAAFARAWDAALMTAANRLVAVAFERATSGTPRNIWREGRLVAEQSIPSDQMLMFLLRHLQPLLFAERSDPAARAQQVAALQGGFTEAITALTDTDVDADLLDVDDYRHHPPSAEQA